MLNTSKVFNQIRDCWLRMVYMLLLLKRRPHCRQIQRIGYMYMFYIYYVSGDMQKVSVLFQSCIFSHPVVNFSALVLQVYLLKICRAMPRAVSSFFAVIKCAHAIFQISDRSQTLYKTVCITSWTECNFIQLYSSMLVKYMAAIQK